MFPLRRWSSRAACALFAAYCAAPAFAVQVIEVPLVTNDVVYNPGDGYLYASVPSTVASAPNSVARIDPFTGAVGPTVFVGSEPRDLAISSDGLTLYVGLDGAGAIRRVNLSTMTAGLQFSLGSDPNLGTLFAEDIEVQPGNPNVIAVSLRNTGFSPRHMGVAVFDNGVVRANRTAQHTGSNVIAFSSSATRLYGYNNETTEFGFRRMDVSSSGVTVVEATANLITGFSNDIEYFDGRIYASTGQVVDPEARTLIGQFTFPSYVYLPAAAPGASRTYFAAGDFYYGGPTRLMSFDPATFAPVENYQIPGTTGSASTLRLLTQDRLALRTDAGAHLYVIDHADQPPTCDLALSVSQGPGPFTVSNPMQYDFLLRNYGQAPAEQAAMRSPLPAGMSYQYSYNPRGGCYDSSGTIVCTFGTVAPQDTVPFAIVLVSQTEGQFDLHAQAGSLTRDSDFSNNSASISTQVMPLGFDRADLAIRFVATPESLFVAGRPVRHELEMTNYGPAAAGRTTFYAAIYGAPVSSLEYESSDFECASDSAFAGCSVDSFPVGAVKHVAVTFVPAAPGGLDAYYSIYANQPDSNYSNNSVIVTGAITPSAEILISGIISHVRLLGLHWGPQQQFTGELEQVTAALAEDDTAAACTALETFQRRIDQRAGRVLTVVQAYQLWYECAYIQYVLGCIAAPYEQPLPPRRPASQVGTSPEIDAGDESAALPRRLELAGAMDRSKPIVLLSMPQAGHARVEVLDVQGRVLGTAFDGELEAGFHRLHWEGRFEGAGPVATGMYFYRVTALGNQLVAKTAVVR